MKENKKTLVRFNVQNIKYATPDATAPHGWAKPLPYGTATKMALESDSSVKKIFGDGRRLCAIVNDKGKTGTMSTNNVNDEYEIAMGRKKRLKNGLADIKQQQTVTHCIYFETCGVDEDGGRPVAKTWLYGVTSSRPSESFDQNTDDINESTFDTPLEIEGLERRKRCRVERRKGQCRYCMANDGNTRRRRLRYVWRRGRVARNARLAGIRR